jgi:hypothetical protein
MAPKERAMSTTTIGRPARAGKRELVIGQGSRG